MFFRRRIIIGMLLCILVFSAFFPVLMGLKSLPKKTFGGEGVLTITSAPNSRNPDEKMADGIAAQDFTEAVSPEIYSLCVIGDVPVPVRGVRIKDFLKFDNLSILEGNITDSPVLLGAKLSKRLNIHASEEIVLTGSTHPCVQILTIDGVFLGSNDDELLVPLETARKTVGMQGKEVSVIRVKTENRSALNDYLKKGNYTVNVGVVGGGSTTTSSSPAPSPSTNEKTERERLSVIALRYPDIREKRLDLNYMSLFIQMGAGSVKVVIFGFVVLSALLTFIGLTAILSRAIIEKKKDIGILYGIGANKLKIHLMLLTDLLKITIPSAVIGTLLGFILAKALVSTGVFVAFGKFLPATCSVPLFIEIVCFSILISCASAYFVMDVLLKLRPMNLISRTVPNREVHELSEVLNETI